MRVGFIYFFINELKLHAVLAFLLDDSLCLPLLRVEDHGNRLHLLLDFMDSLLDLDLFNEVSSELLLRLVQLLLIRHGHASLHMDTCLNLGFEVSDFTFKLGYYLSVFGYMVLNIVHVSLHRCLDVLCTVSILQSVVGVFEAGT